MPCMQVLQKSEVHFGFTFDVPALLITSSGFSAVYAPLVLHSFRSHILTFMETFKAKRSELSTTQDTTPQLSVIIDKPQR